MFFSTELLSRRDSGFGLLWLAATLGAKSSFKKLPKRDVLTADIASLCKAIRDPLEPLALRLSSNLMVGVVRVYRVKQELLMTDVQACSVSLKRTVEEMQTSAGAVSLAQLQMPHTSTRPELLNLHADPGASFAIEFDELIADWGDVMLRGSAGEMRDDDEEYGARPRRKRHQRSSSVPLAEQGRAQHTLNDPNDFLLSPGDSSFPELGGSLGPMSSQLEGARFGTDDRLLDPGDDLGLGGLEDLGRELGWPEQSGAEVIAPGSADPTFNPTFDPDLALDIGMSELLLEDLQSASSRSPRKQGAASPAHEQRDPSLVLDTRVSAQPDPMPEGSKRTSGKKAKKEKLVMDATTEMSDDELKEARAHYLERQEVLKRESEGKKRTRAHIDMVDKIMWGAPPSLRNPSLINFWSTNVTSRLKRTQGAAPRAGEDLRGADQTGAAGIDEYIMSPPPMGEDMTFEPPERARFGSRPLSEVRGLQFGASPATGRQSGTWTAPLSRSSVVPGFPGGEGSVHGSLGMADVNLGQHSRSSSRRASSAGPGGFASGGGNSSYAFESGHLSTQALAADFAFALPGPAVNESQQFDANVAELERDSLDYAKEQLRSLPDTGSVVLDDIVPPAHSTKHVAASVFYHCLVLATKDLIKVQQDVVHGPINITKT